MNDLTTLLGKPRVLRVGGEEHAVYPFTFDDFANLQAWVDSRTPDPLDVATRAIEAGRLVVRDGVASREPWPVAQQQHLLKVAMEQATRGRKLIGTPEADEMIRSMEGVLEILYLSIRKGNPGFTRADAVALNRGMTMGDLERLFRETQVGMVLSDPKPETAGGAEATRTPAGPATPSSAPRRPRRPTGGRSSTSS